MTSNHSNLFEGPNSTQHYMQNCSNYLKNKNIQPLLKNVIYKLCEHQPEDPIEFIIQHFKELQKLDSSRSRLSSAKSTSQHPNILPDNQPSISLNSHPFCHVNISNSHPQASQISLNTHSGPIRYDSDRLNAPESSEEKEEKRKSVESDTISDGSISIATKPISRRRGAVSAEAVSEIDAANYQKVVIPKDY